MITYNVTVTGPLGFQVSVLGPYPSTARLIGDFGSSQEAEAFADWMREIDAGRSYIAPVPSMVHDSDVEMDDSRTDDLIDRNHVLIAAATKARSDARATLLKAEQRREQARVTGTMLNLPIAIFHWRKA